MQTEPEFKPARCPREPLPDDAEIARRLTVGYHHGVAGLLADSAFPGGFDGYGVERDKLALLLRTRLPAFVAEMRRAVIES